MNSREPWKDLHAYWLSKHRDGRPPSRKDLDPLIEIPKLVRNVILLRPEAGSFRYVVVGTEVVKHAGVDMTGHLIGMSITHPQMAEQWRIALDMVSREQKPRLFLSQMPEGVTARYVTLMLPLIAGSGETERIFGGIFFDGWMPEGKRVPGISALDFEG